MYKHCCRDDLYDKYEKMKFLSLGFFVYWKRPVAVPKSTRLFEISLITGQNDPAHILSVVHNMITSKAIQNQWCWSLYITIRLLQRRIRP